MRTLLLDRNLWADKNFCETISKKWDDFIQLNKTDDVSPSLLWETLTAVIRGEIISYSAKIDQMNRTKQVELIKKTSAVVVLNSVSPSPQF